MSGALHFDCRANAKNFAVVASIVNRKLWGLCGD